MKTIMFLLLILAYPLSVMAEERWASELPSHIASEISMWVNLGSAATGEELAAAVWQLGEQDAAYGHAIQGALSEQQIQAIYLYKMERFLLAHEQDLTQEQRQFILGSKETMRRAFDENWDGDTPEYIHFSGESERILGVEHSNALYGVLWPRKSVTVELNSVRSQTSTNL